MRILHNHPTPYGIKAYPAKNTIYICSTILGIAMAPRIWCATWFPQQWKQIGEIVEIPHRIRCSVSSSEVPGNCLSTRLAAEQLWEGRAQRATVVLAALNAHRASPAPLFCIRAWKTPAKASPSNAGNPASSSKCNAYTHMLGKGAQHFAVRCNRLHNLRVTDDPITRHTHSSGKNCTKASSRYRRSRLQKLLTDDRGGNRTVSKRMQNQLQPTKLQDVTSGKDTDCTTCTIPGTCSNLRVEWQQLVATHGFLDKPILHPKQSKFLQPGRNPHAKPSLPDLSPRLATEGGQSRRVTRKWM